MGLLFSVVALGCGGTDRLPVDASADASDATIRDTTTRDTTDPVDAAVSDAADDTTSPVDVGTPDTRDPGRGTLLGDVWITYYFKAVEEDYPGVANTTLYDDMCRPIADVSAAFSDVICIEGSGRLSDGRVLNYASTCSCGRPCPTGGIICYQDLDATRFPWGLGNRGNALEPLRWWATDRSFIASGTILYSPDWDGVAIPDVDGIGDYVHDGCFRADDVGGAIDGNHVDVFAGTRSMWLALESIHPTRTNITVYENPPRCAHLM
jgi:3D (Asp-Asp-Asp) domain-containing protein